MLSTARGTYTITGLLPALEDRQPQVSNRTLSEEFEFISNYVTINLLDRIKSTPASGMQRSGVRGLLHARIEWARRVAVVLVATRM